MTLALFVRLWRWLLPLAALLAALAVALGLFSSGAAPAWLFAAAVVVALAGGASLATDLALRAKESVEDMLDGDDQGPSGPTTPKTGRG